MIACTICGALTADQCVCRFRPEDVGAALRIMIKADRYRCQFCQSCQVEPGDDRGSRYWACPKCDSTYPEVEYPLEGQ